MFWKVLSQVAIPLVETIERLAYRRFYRFPFGRVPWATADEYREIWAEAKDKVYPVIDNYEKELNCSIDKDWYHALGLLTQVVVKELDICYEHGRLLYATLGNYIRNNSYKSINVVETGTARGFSALCMARAFYDFNCEGKIMTFDVLPHDVKMLWNCIGDTSGSQTRSRLLKDYSDMIERFIVFHQGNTRLELKKVKMGRIHFVFLDGEHLYDYVKREFDCIKDQQRKGDVMFFDDYTPAYFPGIVKAVDEICDRYNYSKRVVTVNEQRGYVVAYKR